MLIKFNPNPLFVNQNRHKVGRKTYKKVDANV